MTDAAIVARGLSKRYRIGEKRAAYKTLRDTISSFATSAWRRERTAGNGGASPGDNMVWALRDVSFEVRPGEVVGVIGRNGAGKSTLLKVLSRITEPTGGEAVIRGRVGSLLEVGTGFHQELTGRENTYLNGAILGMRRREIDQKLDEIVEFAELSRFIDTPVKHYSSGMYLRLAFAVAAHMQTEILLVDEVLAVGDMRFQKRCLGKMESVAAEGRTVLFVSHNLGALKELCQTALLLEGGTVAHRGPVVEALARYTGAFGAPPDSTASRGTMWSGLRISGRNGDVFKPILSGEPFAADVDLRVEGDYSNARLYCLIDNSAGDHLLHHFIGENEVSPKGLTAGRYRVRVHFPPLWVIPDVYTLSFKLFARNRSGREETHFSERLLLNVTDDTEQSVGRVKAILIPPLQWELSLASSGDEEVPSTS